MTFNRKFSVNPFGCLQASKRGKNHGGTENVLFRAHEQRRELSTQFHNYGGIRASMHPRALRRARSTIFSVISPHSRALRAGRLAALVASPYLWNRVLRWPEKRFVQPFECRRSRRRSSVHTFFRPPCVSASPWWIPSSVRSRSMMDRPPDIPGEAVVWGWVH
jgi:hypothetical protein